MNVIKHIGLTFLQLARRVGSLPKSIKNAANQRRQQAILDKCEAERLDRICNPFK